MPNQNPTQQQFDFVGMLQRRFWIVILCVIFATGGGVYWYWKSDVKFTSYARVYIEMQDAQVSIIGNDGFPIANKITSHDQIIKSETVLLNATDEILRFIREGSSDPEAGLDDTDGVLDDDSPLADDSLLDEEAIAANEKAAANDAEIKKSTAFAELQGLNRGQILSHLSRSISVVQDRKDKSIYQVSYTGGIKNDCRVILSIVISQYEKHLARKFKNDGEELIKKIEKARSNISEKIATFEKEFYEWRTSKARGDLEKFGEGIFITEDGKRNNYRVEAQNLYVELEALKKKKEKVADDQRWIESAIASEMSKQEILTHIDKFSEWLQLEQRKLSAAPKPPVMPILKPTELPLQFDEPEESSALIQARFEVDDTKSELDLLLEKGFGSNHPDVKSKQRRLDRLKQQVTTLDGLHKEKVAKAKARFEVLKKAREDAEKFAEKNKPEIVPEKSELPEMLNEIDLIGLHQSYLNQELLRINNDLVKLQTRYEDKKSRASQVDDLLAQERELQKKIDDQRNLNEIVLQKIREINLEKDNGGYNLDLLASPSGGSQTEPSVLKIFAITSFLGLAIGVGFGYLIEVADKTFRSPTEIAQQLGMQVIGHVPVLSTKKVNSKGSKLDETLIAFHLPKSQQAEAFRAIRTSIFFNAQGKSSQIIQVTSPTPGDGKSTLAANLAISLAQSGKRVLLCDSDLRRPTVNYLFGTESETGFAAVLNGDAEIEDAILDCEVDGLSLMPAGSRPANPSELLTSSQLYDLFEVLREKFDFIIMDSPPMLAVTDPTAVAARVDGVILALRIKKNIKLSAGRAKEILDSVGANIMGIVVNGAGMVQGSYSNSAAYGYGTGYASSYYSYGYDYGESTYYYDEENRPTTAGRPSP